MTIRINVHQTHRRFTDGLKMVEVKGTTVGDCLSHLIKQFPAMEQEIFKKKGQLRNNVEIFINMASAYPDELAKPVSDGDEIHITLMLAGG
ncbi:MoaD/ThiS family protein [Thermodesulfobacteriota bacterium]